MNLDQFPAISGRHPNTAWAPVFLEFLQKIKITSKEMQAPGPIAPYEAQIRFLNEICLALEAEQHFAVCLKARQLGISTLVWALDIFWLWMHPGLQGAMIFDTGDNRDIARQTITEMIESLPPGYRIPIKSHNRTALWLTNGSRLQYMAAGKKKNSTGLGRSRALNFIHASEMSSWGDDAGLKSLLRSLAEENPSRLYLFESTALGFNMFHQMCETAKASPSQRFFFIGWWAKELYRCKEGTPEFKRWWGANPYLTDEERVKCALVKENYGHEISNEQIAWYRKQQFDQSAETLAAELPWDESEAFVATGTAYFSAKRITEDMKFISSAQVSFSGYRYSLGKVFTDTRIAKVDKAEDADLKIWEEPRKEGRYVIGVDGAFGRSETADRSVISVWRCFADKCLQVAEFATPRPESYQTAWVMAHLAGVYRDCMINVDLLGPGELIMAELKHLKQQMAFGQLRQIAADMKILDALNNARWYLSHRLDQTGVGSYLYNTKTTQDEKARLYGGMRDGYNLETILPRSLGLLDEMRTLRQDGLKIEASGRNKDDRVFAAALAVGAWTKWIRPEMMAKNQTFAREMARQSQNDKNSAIGDHVMHGLVQRHFEKKRQERVDEMRRRLIEGF